MLKQRAGSGPVIRIQPGSRASESDTNESEVLHLVLAPFPQLLLQLHVKSLLARKRHACPRGQILATRQHSRASS